MKFLHVLLTALPLIGTALSPSAMAGEVRVAVATLLAEPLRAIAESFEKDTGNKVVLTVGNTSELLRQIIGGAKYDLLLPNNTVVLKELEDRNLVVAGTRYTYATNSLVLWSPQEGYVDPQGQVLTRKKFDRLSIVSPALVYGRPAKQVLDNLGIASEVAAKLVERHDIAQSRQFVAAGGPDLGIVTLSQVYANGKLARGSAWLIPQSLYDPIRQQAVILDDGRNNPTARSFQFYLKGSKAGSILLAYGYKHEVIAGSF
ncbi:Molybdate-binding periplasmic protein [Achromobacter veterisilvae]|jgi:molybdate transport system substrate-binding protein|uniref:Molybdate-binding periplasmic protein n=1 Tax=Achromobacter veterisilvae TaxID=2069367 RepID=A0A446CR67_9BURK|nr:MULTISPECIES: molybdate ABC transporter substrate-binding protein [Achromobacter]MCW0205937.1 molybdate ABC transporter substrate-binding protein [Achromobacter sp.]SSW70339.1 Molybdate-binding periplasmic protein [Achromobacter veterisilvae]